MTPRQCGLITAPIPDIDSVLLVALIIAIR